MPRSTRTDELIGWVARGAADGYNLSVPDLVPFAEQIVPLLQQRGVYRRAYSGTTLRDNLSQHDG
jgi:alkanesulfonate monooxygenase SsuD/methylene tetrahydromethanopterin reductase-like flavin-dependent oxidoreductase (luciferase family)